MYSSEELERFYFEYQTEWMSRGMSIQAYCSRNNVPYKVLGEIRLLRKSLGAEKREVKYKRELRRRLDKLRSVQSVRSARRRYTSGAPRARR